MSKVKPPPLYEPVTDDGRIATIPWTLFFNQLYIGDTGNDWTPNFVGLTTVGTPTITGKYYKLSQNLAYYSIRIVPATSTSAVAGTTYIDNFPLNITQDGANLVVSGTAGGGSGIAAASSQRVYVAAWTGVTIPVTIVGLAEVR